MTVSNTPRRAGPFSGNGATTAFPFAFKVFAPSDVAVYLTDENGVQSKLNSGYLVTLNADQDAAPGGTVNYTPGGLPMPAGQKLDVASELDYKQATDLTNLGRFSPNVIENALDRITILAQQLLERWNRVLSFPIGDTKAGGLPSAAVRAHKALVFDGDGNATVSADDYDDQVANVTAQANAAAASAGAAAGSQAAAAASATSVKYLYPGTYAAAPATRPDGAAMQAGDAYFNATNNLGYRWNGATWVSSDINTANLAAAGGASLIGFQLSYGAAAVQDLLTTLRYSGAVSLTQFMQPADIADLALATPLRDQTANIQAAIDSGAKRIMLPVGNYRVSTGGIVLKDGTHLIGAGSVQGAGARIYFTKNDGTHCFTSAQNNFLSFCCVENIEVLNSANAAGTVGAGDAFHLYGVTNNCAFKNLLIRNFGGSAFSIGQQTLNPADKTAAQNVLFERVFVISCGGYAFDINGYVNATWLMCDLNSCATGFFRFQDGTTNQTMINIFGLWIEGTQAWTALTVFDMQDTKGQMLNVVGGNITNSRAGTSRVVKSTTSSCRLNFQGTGFGWTYLHEDTPAGYNTALSAPTARFQAITTPQATVQGAGPNIDLFEQVSGTADQRRFRWSVSSNNLLLSARDDTGASVRNLLFTNFVSGSVSPGTDNFSPSGTATNRWSVIYAGNGTINTSDGREKEQVRELSDAERAVAMRLKSLIRAFKFSDAVQRKGEDARIHVGVIAQDVATAFAAEGLDAHRYGVFCYDEWDEQPEVLDAQGEVVTPHRPAGDRFGVRYEQLLAFVVSAL